MTPSPPSILFLIRRLDLGGTERQLTVLARGLAAAGHRVGVVSFYSGGEIEDEFTGTTVHLISLNKKGRWNIAAPLIRLVRQVRKEKPRILHSYLPMVNVIATMLRPFMPGTKIIWGIRGSFSDASVYDRMRGFSFALERWLSATPDLIIANSQRGRCVAVDRGYPSGRLIVVPNGIDTSRFRPDSEARKRQRAAWNLSEGNKVIGMVARLDPVKDHDTYLAAAKIAAAERDELRFVVVGKGSPKQMAAVTARAATLGLGSRLIFEGPRFDMETVYNALDLATLTSCRGEGFPNVLAEAMSCGVPCVSTDVGDSAKILGEAGLVIPPRDPNALAGAWSSMLDRLADEPDLKPLVRERIVHNFGETVMIQRSIEAFYGVLGRG